MYKPECPHCKNTVNVVRLVVGFRCAFCRKKFLRTDEVRTDKGTTAKEYQANLNI